QIDGGTAVNILSERCSFTWDTRAIDLDHPAIALEALKSLAEEMKADNRHIKSIETEIIADAPGLAPQQDNAAETLVRRLTGANATSVVAFATEAGHFQSAGFDTIVFGPGDIAQAHQPNEFIAISQLQACDAFLAKLIRHLS
ncbi:MAG: M20/M25/M40 family metallo-hydrolase, partial [Pseudomonadota bacterium]